MADRDRRFVDEVIDVPFDPHQAELYRKQVTQRKELPNCIYPLWDNLKGKGKGGEFALTIARHYFRNCGYEVFVSDSKRENPECFILASYPGLRKERPFHPGYKRMIEVFGEEKLEAFNKHATELKRRRKKTRNSGGGDPDLFVRSKINRDHFFFAEVKYKDSLLENQKAVFPLVSKMLGCKVLLVHIRPIEFQVNVSRPKKLAAVRAAARLNLGTAVDIDQMLEEIERGYQSGLPE